VHDTCYFMRPLLWPCTPAQINSKYDGRMERRLRRLKNMRLRRAKTLAREVFGMRGTYHPAWATWPTVHYVESYRRGGCPTPCVCIEVDGEVPELDVRCTFDARVTYGQCTDRSLPTVTQPNITLRDTLCSCDGCVIKPEELFVRILLGCAHHLNR
jgi:hypothetical protein